ARGAQGRVVVAASGVPSGAGREARGALHVPAHAARGEGHTEVGRETCSVRAGLLPGIRRGARGGERPRGRERTLGLITETAMSERAMTLAQFVLQQERLHPEASGQFTSLLLDIALAAKMINK